MSLQTARSTHAIVFIISRIEPTAPGNLEDRLLTQLGVHDDKQFRSVVETVRAHPTKLPIDTSRPGDLTAAQRRLVDIKIDCGVRELNATCPLQPGEQETASPQGGLLSAQWQHLPAGTPVVTRTTNYCTVHMAWPNLRAVNNELLEPTPQITVLAGDPDPCWKWDRPIPDDSNAHALYNEIITVLGAGLNLSGFGFVFPFLTWFGTLEFKAVSLKDVFEIATCRAQKVAKAEDIELIIDALSGMGQYLQDTYLPAKKKIEGTSGSDRKAKMDLARDVAISILTTNRNNIAMLSTDDLGFDGLVPYVAGASVVLSLYQELSTVDSTVATPDQSTFITSMKEFATEAAGHVQAEVNSIKSTRSSAIVISTITAEIDRCSVGINPTCVKIGDRVVGARWDDQISGESSGEQKIQCRE